MISNGSPVVVSQVAGPGVPVPGKDVDTDQIVPARFLREVTFDNMGRYAFYDVRHHPDGTPNDHPFNRYEGARLLLAGQNFGCGSSREHAPQALMRWGIRGLVGASFAEIFAGNCQALGLPTATTDGKTIDRLTALVEADPATTLTLDVRAETVTAGPETFAVRIAPSQKEALLNGLWDTTALMKSYLDDVERTRRRLPYLNGFAPPPAERDDDPRPRGGDEPKRE